MRFHEITEAKFSKPEIFYHGTSKKHLPSILKHGLRADKTGSGWSGSERGNVYMRGLKSYGGVYMTDNIDRSYVAASAASDLNRDGITVIIQFQPRSGVLDEDTVEKEIAEHLEEDLGAHAMPRFLNDLNQDPDAVIDNIFDSSENLEIFGEAVDTIPHGRKILTQFLKVYAIRIIAYMVLDPSEWDLDDEYVNNPPVPIPDTQTAEAQYRNELDKISRLFKKLAYDKNYQMDRGTRSIRSFEDITFTGTNRIIGIVDNEDKPDENGEITHRILYGQVPKQAVDDFSTLHDGKFVQFAKNGKIVASGVGPEREDEDF